MGDQNVTSDLATNSRASASRLTVGAMAILLLLCLIWGGNQVAIKISSRGFEPIFAATLRSIGAAILLALYGLITRQRLWVKGEALKYAIAVGLFFGLEFIFVFSGTRFTHASRGTVLLYTSPFWVALGAHFLLRERLTPLKVGGLLLAFGGVLAVFAANPGELGSTHLLGDFMEIVGAVFWASETLLGKKAMTKSLLTPLQVIFWQCLVSIPLLFAASLALEGVPQVEWRADAVLALAHQTVIVATVTYLVWYWLLSRFPASSIASFSFFTPLFGVMLGGIILSEPITWLLIFGVALVAAGIYVVQRE